MRLRDPADHRSWDEFLTLYGPLILRYVRRFDVNRDDALELVQETLKIVFQQIGKFDYDPDKGTFRSWLYTVTKHRTFRFLRERQREPVGRGGTTNVQVLHQQGDDHCRMDDIWEQEWRQNALQAAMRQVRPQVEEATWESFRLAALEGVPSQEVADRLGLTVGQVYVNKSRVLKRLREAVEGFDE